MKNPTHFLVRLFVFLFRYKLWRSGIHSTLGKNENHNNQENQKKRNHGLAFTSGLKTWVTTIYCVFYYMGNG